MTHLNHPKPKNRLTTPAALLPPGLLLAIGLMLLPARCSHTMKGCAAALLRPGQVGVLSLRDRGRGIVARAKTHFDTAAQLAEARQQCERLAEENRRLTAELTAARVLRRRSNSVQNPSDDPYQRLLTARCVKARVLGQQARAFLARQYMLDVGSQAGVQPDALVVDAPPELIDLGSDAGLEAGQLVLSRGRVWGKVVEVGPSTSIVRTVTEPGYHDLVQLAGQGPQGILEGTGEPLARVRLIEVTEPVALGDPVCAAAAKGVLPEPLLYGRIVRLQRPVGAAHWEIWMQPAARPGRTEQVAVLRIELNPQRVAACGSAR